MAASTLRHGGEFGEPDYQERAMLSNLYQQQRQGKDNEANDRRRDPDGRRFPQPDRAEGEEHQDPPRQSSEDRRGHESDEEPFEHGSRITP